MRIFILEDDHERIKTFRRKLIGHEIVVAETAQEAINALGTHKDAMTRASRFDLIFLDHDLGGEQMVSTAGRNTGSEVVRWMVTEMGKCPSVIVHSLNTPAALEMQNKLCEIGVDCHRIPFTKLVHDLDEPNFIGEAK
jgi:CheY-like chemotaxis protein